MAVAEKNATICGWCGEKLTPEEVEYPEHRQGEIICEDCLCEFFHFRCCICQECEDIEYQQEIGSLFVVAESVEGLSGDVRRGVYEIIEHPYYADGVVEGHLYNDALKRLGRVPRAADTGLYPSGHVCRECAAKLREQLAKKEAP